MILIVSYSLGLDLFERSKIDTEETSLNVASVSSLLNFDNSKKQNLKDMRQLLEMGTSFYYLKMPLNLTQHFGAVETFNTWKSIFQRSLKTFPFLNYVNINSFQSYSLSTFILFVFLFLGLQYNGHKISMIINFFVWFLFLIAFSLNSSFWFQIPYY